MFVDSHCHLDFPELAADLDGILERMRTARVSHALCISVTLEDFPRVLATAAPHPHLFASVGVHPDYDGVEEPSAEALIERARDPKVVAIGETGLDYFRLPGGAGLQGGQPVEHAPPSAERQQARFRAHIRAARATGKPLVVHTRSASEDTIRLLKEEGADAVGGVLHCFTESWAVARAALDLNFRISFSGIVTFKNAADLRDTAARVPLDRLLIETDAPYLAPVPMRGKRNEPGYVPHVAALLGQVRGMSAEAIGEVTTNNFFDLFSTARR